MIYLGLYFSIGLVVWFLFTRYSEFLGWNTDNNMIEDILLFLFCWPPFIIAAPFVICIIHGKDNVIYTSILNKIRKGKKDD